MQASSCLSLAHSGDQKCRDLIRSAGEGTNGQQPSAAAKFYSDFFAGSEPEERFNAYAHTAQHGA